MNPATYRCPKCKRAIGRFDGDILVVAGMYVKELHGVCTCGHEFHYTLSGRRFERLVDTWQERVECSSDIMQ